MKTYNIPKVPKADIGKISLADLQTLRDECDSRFTRCIEVRDIAQESANAIQRLRLKITGAEIEILKKSP